MTSAQYEKTIDAAIAARIAAEPRLARCVCGHDSPELYRLYHYSEQHCVECACGREVCAPTKADAITMWNDLARALEQERSCK